MTSMAVIDASIHICWDDMLVGQLCLAGSAVISKAHMTTVHLIQKRQFHSEIPETGTLGPTLRTFLGSADQLE